MQIDFDNHRWVHENNNFNGLHINSTDEQIIFNDQIIYANSIKMLMINNRFIVHRKLERWCCFEVIQQLKMII